MHDGPERASFVGSEGWGGGNQSSAAGRRVRVRVRVRVHFVCAAD